MSMLNLAETTLRVIGSGSEQGGQVAARRSPQSQVDDGEGFEWLPRVLYQSTQVRDHVQELVGVVADLLRRHAQEVDTLPS